VIVLPGALTVGADYAELARELSKHFTVHVVDRRGHGASGPQGADYSVSNEVAVLFRSMRLQENVRMSAG
jgi:pimeloyl-ACP methyl ester carboxylesterase